MILLFIMYVSQFPATKVRDFVNYGQNEDWQNTYSYDKSRGFKLRTVILDKTTLESILKSMQEILTPNRDYTPLLGFRRSSYIKKHIVFYRHCNPLVDTILH